MSLVDVNGLSLVDSGPTLSLALGAGQIVVIFGPTRGGKSRLLRCVVGIDRPSRGAVTLGGDVDYAGLPSIGSRAKVHRLGHHSRHANSLTRSTELMLALRLFDRRNDFFGSLTLVEQAAAELLRLFASDGGICAIDGHFDGLDPWALSGAMELLGLAKDAGRTTFLVTNSVEVAGIADLIVVISDEIVRFAGTRQELLERAAPVRIAVETTHGEGVRALCAPFEVEIAEYPDRLEMRARAGQQLAAKLLADGYGDVTSIVLQQPTLAEALRTVVR